ncbi:hypothetical protein AOQ84DRAFT_383982 [Glonium stellatum]|uniref:Uncharacterized protein n=1 Tax=Glonium stellatum TaxID=574774 RepID=A0A8E2EMH6_9PEZI|nr:hypothetical protein AOQ84DRAFT_383982 [Glonium stellatum]
MTEQTYHERQKRNTKPPAHFIEDRTYLIQDASRTPKKQRTKGTKDKRPHKDRNTQNDSTILAIGPLDKARKAKENLFGEYMQQTTDAGLPSKAARKEMLFSEDLEKDILVSGGRPKLRGHGSRALSESFSVRPRPTIADKCANFIENLEKGTVPYPPLLSSPSFSTPSSDLGGNRDYGENAMDGPDENDHYGDCAASLPLAVQVLVDSLLADKALIAVQRRKIAQCRVKPLTRYTIKWAKERYRKDRVTIQNLFDGKIPVWLEQKIPQSVGEDGDGDVVDSSSEDCTVSTEPSEDGQD